ncbi:hypothetical protein C0J52_24824 [Blattella germanica]|nr:hypothetical protein C0J52_24824 [Blattella germanica]
MKASRIVRRSCIHELLVTRCINYECTTSDWRTGSRGLLQPLLFVEFIMFGHSNLGILEQWLMPPQFETDNGTPPRFHNEVHPWTTDYQKDRLVVKTEKHAALPLFLYLHKTRKSTGVNAPAPLTSSLMSMSIHFTVCRINGTIGLTTAGSKEITYRALIRSVKKLGKFLHI